VVPRVVTALIVCFWLVMTTLLVRMQLNPNGSTLMVVPPSHLFKLMFTHEQLSELEILDGTDRIGNLMIRPKTDEEHNSRTLTFVANLSLRLPGVAKRQRISWDGTVLMDRSYAVKSVDLGWNSPEPPYHLHLDLSGDRKSVTYEIKQGSQTVHKASMSLDQEGLTSLLREAGIDPSIVQGFPGTISAPAVTARQTEMRVRNEKIVAYLLSVSQGDTALVEMYVSQIGQVMSVKTITNYSLATEDVLPPQ
jgi:hypothetical protein